MQRIWASIERPADHPCLFAFGTRPGRGEFTSEGHRIVYRVRPDTGLNETAGDVEVLRVYGSCDAEPGKGLQDSRATVVEAYCRH
jgi:hypothetical protein